LAAVPSAGRAARVEQTTAPESDATRDLYERFSGQILGYCLHHLGSREEAEDAVQTTFMNAFRALRRGIVPQVESAWLFKIAHNVCLSRRRSTRRRGRVEAPNNFEVLQEVVPAREQSGDELIRLQDALETMPETQRRAILLREWQGLSYREIAAELDVTQSAVETLIFRARRALASGLEVEPAQWRKRARHGFDAGTLAAALKGLLTAGTAAKVAATIAVATTAAVAVSSADHHAAAPVRVPTTKNTLHSTSVSRSFTAATIARVRVAAHRVQSQRPSHTALVRRHGTSHTSAPASPSTVSVTAPPTSSAKGSNGNVDKRISGAGNARPTATHGLAKGHEKHSQVHAARPSANPSLPATPPDNPPVEADQQNGNGSGHGHG